MPTRVQLADGLTKSSAGVFLRVALISGTAQLHRNQEDLEEEATHWQVERRSG